MESKVIANIKDCLDRGNKLVVVVSAIGRKGEPYATDSLIGLLEDINSDIDPEKKDLIMSCGEIISASILAHLLDRVNIPSVALTGFQAGILTDKNFNSAKIIDIDTSTIEGYLNNNKVVVIAGFQGITEDGQITTLGRGGSDTTAVALAAFLGAHRVDIFTDVPGVAFDDPKLVPDTKYIDYISYDNMYKLACKGAKVIDSNAVSIACKHNIPIRISSTETNERGTLIWDLNKIANK